MTKSLRVTKALGLAVAAAALLGAAPAALAEESQFGCKYLAENPTLPSVEGKEGFFFRVFADLRMQHAMTDEVVSQLGQLSAALKAQGTTLIYVPIPTKSMTLPEFLPDDVHLYGFDEDVAVAVYDDQIRRLREKGLLAVDLLAPLRSNDAGNPPFYRSDFHWTSEGARRAAETIAATIKGLSDYADVTPVQFETVETGDELSVSGMRRSLQAYCTENLPPVVTKAYVTSEVASEEAALDIFGGGGGSGEEGGSADEIALVGTSFSDADVPNFGGFLAQYASLPVSNMAITGGNQFGAITSYLTSRSFAESRPRFLVWENPIYNNLAQFGVGPMAELIAAATNDCEPLPAKPEATDTPGEIRVDLSGTAIDRSKVLLADAGDTNSRDIHLSFHTPDGKTLTHEIRRGPRFLATGRFYIPLEPLTEDKFSDVVIKFDRANPDEAMVSFCSLHQQG